MKKSFIISGLCALLLALSPFLFLSGKTDSSKLKPNTYRAVYSAAVKSIDPATCGDVTSASIQGNFYESLYTYHYLKRPVEVIPQLAQGMPEITDSGKTYIIHIKEGVKYHKNPCFSITGSKESRTRDIRAEDFVLAFKRIADYHINTGLGWAFLANRIEGLDEYREKTRHYSIGDFSRYGISVKGIKALDSLTLQIKLKKPFPQFIYVLAMNVYAPVPQEVIDYHLTTRNTGEGARKEIPVHERTPEIRERQEVIGTGPYTLETWKRKWKIILERNPLFRDEFYPDSGEPRSEGYNGDQAEGLLKDAGEKVPFIDHIRYRFIEEEYSSWMMFLSRRVDAASIPREAFNSFVTPDKNLADKWKEQGITLKRSLSPAIYWIVFNMEDSLMGASRKLRQAMHLSYDVESKIEVLLNERGKRAVNIIPTNIKGHSEAGPGPYAEYNPEKAKRLLKEAKKELREKGLLEEGEIPELQFDLSNSPNATRLADFTKQQFAKIGIKIKPVFNDWPTLQRKVNNKQVQMYTMGWHADYPDAENFLQLFYSGNIKRGTNNANYSNPVFDSLYEKARIMRDCPERTNLYAKMTNIISRDCPVILLYEPESFVVYHNWVSNVKSHSVGYGYQRYRKIDTELKSKELGGRK
ncbi:MAG: ABC transporter substrate-binding protein [Chitinivibrionales bacterium]